MFRIVICMPKISCCFFVFFFFKILNIYVLMFIDIDMTMLFSITRG